MSIVRNLLNAWLRTVEKRRLRTKTPDQIRRAFEQKVRFFFHPPQGTVQEWTTRGTIKCLELTTPATEDHRLLLYIHGGGFVFGSPATHSALAAQLAHRIGARAVLPKYGLAPEAPFPAAPQDVRAAWDGLLADGYLPEHIILAGDSAGGALAFGLLGALCAEGAPVPGAVFGFSPLADLTYSGESFSRNAASDVVLPADRAIALADMFLAGADGKTPEVSPLFADFPGAPPCWITVGDTEILLDDARRLAGLIRKQGADVTLVEEPDVPHVWPLFHNILPEARQTLDALAKWIRQQQDWDA